MDLQISDQMERMLYRAVKDRNGKLSVTLAERMYSSNQQAKSAIDKLELAGFIERSAPGYWDVVKVTDDIKEMIKAKEDDDNDSKSGDDFDGSDYKIEDV